MGIKLVVGLGNPGSKYERTRHNLGYRVLERMVRLEMKTSAELFTSTLFMNETGREVAEHARYMKISPEEILVVCDDFSLPLGHTRIRLGGSSGGHNGLDSILVSLGTQNVPRLRIGIGPVPENVDPARFVLENFQSWEFEKVDLGIQRGANAVVCAVNESLEKAMNQYNPEPS